MQDSLRSGINSPNAGTPVCSPCLMIWPFLFCFSPETEHGITFSNLSRSTFLPNFFDGPNIFQILADSAAICLVLKLSKSEPSSRFFGHLKFRKSLPGSVLPKFPRRIQNRNGHLSLNKLTSEGQGHPCTIGRTNFLNYHQRFCCPLT